VREKLVRLPQPPSNTKANRAGHSKVQRAIWQHISFGAPQAKKSSRLGRSKPNAATSGPRLGSGGLEEAFSSISVLPKRLPFFLTAWTKKGSKKKENGA